MKWEQAQTLINTGRLAQCILLVSPVPRLIQNHAYHLASGILCKNAQEKPCGTCKSCILFKEEHHPDFHKIFPEKTGKSIKMDELRGLQDVVYKTSTLGGGKVIYLPEIEFMSISVSNALLKIIEEPPQNTYFILSAAFIATLLPTVLSRSQVWNLSNDEIKTESWIDSLKSKAPEIAEEAANFLYDLLGLIEGKIPPTALAEKFKKYDMSELMQALYLITSQLILQKFARTSLINPLDSKLASLEAKLSTPSLFNFLKQINAIQKKLSHTINVNPLLSLENLFMEIGKTREIESDYA